MHVEPVGVECNVGQNYTWHVGAKRYLSGYDFCLTSPPLHSCWSTCSSVVTSTVVTSLPVVSCLSYLWAVGPHAFLTPSALFPFCSPAALVLLSPVNSKSIHKSLSSNVQPLPPIPGDHYTSQNSNGRTMSMIYLKKKFVLAHAVLFIYAVYCCWHK